MQQNPIGYKHPKNNKIYNEPMLKGTPIETKVDSFKGLIKEYKDEYGYYHEGHQISEIFYGHIDPTYSFSNSRNLLVLSLEHAPKTWRGSEVGATDWSIAMLHIKIAYMNTQNAFSRELKLNMNAHSFFSKNPNWKQVQEETILNSINMKKS